MSTEGVHRKLAAILCADVEGYSRLMQDDPEGTLHTLKDHREIFRRCTEYHEGRVVDSPGDNILIEFTSAIEAVQCAVEIQSELAEKNAELSEDRRMRFRIGIDLGDLLEQDEALYGDGVNISARLQSLAESSGICVSGRAYDQVVNRLPLRFEFLGKRSVKNIAHPIRVYRVLAKPGGAINGVIQTKLQVSRQRQKIAMAIAVVLLIIAGAGLIWQHYLHSPPEQPSIAVLPFANMSSDPEQEYFVDGLSEELLNCLTKINGLRVTSRTSSFAFKNNDKPLQEVADVLGVEYILEGSVRKAGDDLRITAQLIRVKDDSHLWSEMYNRELRDIFAIQEDIATTVANELKLTLGIGKSLQQLGGTDNLEAYGYYLVAKGQMWDSEDLDVLDRCIELLDKAVSLDPEFALAWKAKADYHFIRSFRGAADRTSAELDVALKSAHRAIQIEPNLPQAYISLKAYYEMTGDWIESERTAQKALDLLTGTSPDVENMIALFDLSVGFLEKAQGIYEKILPIDPFNKLTRADYMLALAFRGNTDKAEEEYNRVRTFFGGDWELGDIYITILRLGDKKTLSRDKILYLSPICVAVMEHLESPEHALSELHRIYADFDNPSYNSLMYISYWAAHFGDAEFALETMWKAMRLNTAGTFWIWSPVMHDVRQLPRFKEFVREIGLVDYWEKFGWPDLCHPADDGDFVCD